jgi:hypothetical protein
LARNRAAVTAAIALLLLTGACTPSKVLKSGPYFNDAVALAQAFCSAAATPDPADERALFDDELGLLFDAVDPAEREAAGLLTSADPSPHCRVGRVRTFGPPPDHVIGVHVRLELAGARDSLYLSNAYRRLRIANLTYGRPRRVGNETAHNLEMALRILAIQADRKGRTRSRQ